MKVLDATFLVDYLSGVEATAEFLIEHEAESFVIPAPAYAEVLCGAGNAPDGDPAAVRADLHWAEVHETSVETAELAGDVAAAIGPEGPMLSGVDALIAAVGRETGAPVVSADTDLTHPETRAVVDVESYR